jgi:hypothetical protein
MTGRHIRPLRNPDTAALVSCALVSCRSARVVTVGGRAAERPAVDFCGERVVIAAVSNTPTTTCRTGEAGVALPRYPAQNSTYSEFNAQ